MARNGIRLEDKDVLKEFDKMMEAPEKVIKRTISDFKQRAPAWVAREVVKTYNVEKSEINPAKENRGYSSIGSIRAVGHTIDAVALIYKGRLLTPVHFGMTPEEPAQTYTLKAKFKKGKQVTLGKFKKLTKKQRKNVGRNFTRQGTKSSNRSPVMLIYIGNKKHKQDDNNNDNRIDFIPFQRKSQRRNDIHPVKTLSMPQMVSNLDVNERIHKAIDVKLGKRFDHYMKRYYE